MQLAEYLKKHIAISSELTEKNKYFSNSILEKSKLWIIITTVLIVLNSLEIQAQSIFLKNGQTRFGKGGRRGIFIESGLNFPINKNFNFGVSILQGNGSNEYVSNYGVSNTKTSVFKSIVSITQLNLSGGFTKKIYKKFYGEIKVQPLISYRVDDLPSSFTVFFPVITKLPDPIYVIEYQNQLKTFAFGLRTGLELKYKVSNKVKALSSFDLQKDNLDTIRYFSLGVNYNFKE